MILKRSRYRHLFFDLDNTLWDFNRNSGDAMVETFRKYQLDESGFDRFFTTYNRHNDRLWEIYRNNGITKQELTRQRFDLTFQEVGIHGIDPLAFNNTYLELMPLQTHLCEGAVEVLGKLSGKYRMHIITNGFSEVQYKKMANSGLAPFFERIFVSEEIKSPKPSPGIFRHALKSCNARKRESLMIGDSWDVDIVGAMQVGIDQVLYTPDLKSETSPAPPSLGLGPNKTVTYRISFLRDLLTIL